MRIGPADRFWVVTEPTSASTIPDICFACDLRGLALQVAGGLDLAAGVAIYDTQDEALEDAKNRLLVQRVARQIRLDRGLPEGEVVRVTLHDKDGKVLFQGEVR